MRRGRSILYVIVGAAVVVLAVGQLLLPRIAAARLRSRLGRYGEVESVSVSAWPAIKLLWGSADSVRVRAGTLALSTTGAESLLWEARESADLTLSARRVRIAGLQLTSVSLTKHGRQLSAQASASASAVDGALPAGVQVQLLRSGDGEVEVRASGSLFGLGAAVDAVAAASEGNLVVKPLGLLGAFQLTLFSDPHVYVEGVGASVDDSGPLGYRLSMSALLR
jgi:hypothetical protein